MEQVNAIAAEHGVDLKAGTVGGRFAELLAGLHKAYGRRVVVLVDEYDKPILDAIAKPEVARANRDFLSGLYSVIKDCDAHVRFTLLAGVSKFSKVNLFSGLNNLEDITLDPEYSTICGYTEADLDTVFAPEMAGLDRNAVRDGTTGTRGAALSASTIPSTSCCSAGGESTERGGSIRARRPSSWTR